MSWTDNLTREVNPAKLGKAVACLLAVGLVATFVFKGIPAGVRYFKRVQTEKQTRALMRKVYSVPGKTPSIAGQNMVVRDLTENGGQSAFDQPVQVVRLLTTESVRNRARPDWWTVSGVGMVRTNIDSELIPILWSREIRWDANEKLWFGDMGTASYRYEKDGTIQSSSSRRGGLGSYNK